MSKIKPQLPTAKRKALIDAGLIALEKRGRAQHILLTDRGWAWSAANLDKLCPKGSPGVNAEIVGAMLGAISQTLGARQLSLAEFARPEMFEVTGRAEPETTAEQASVEEAIAEIRRECEARNRAARGGRIRLSDLREVLPQFDRETFDTALLQLQSANEIVLSTLERFEVQPRDEAAAISVAGLPREVVYLKHG